MDGKPFFPTVYCWGIGGRNPTAWEINELKSHNFNTIMLMSEMFHYRKPAAPCGSYAEKIGNVSKSGIQFERKSLARPQ